MTASEALDVYAVIMRRADMLKALDCSFPSRAYDAYWETWRAAKAVERLAAELALDELRAAK